MVSDPMVSVFLAMVLTCSVLRIFSIKIRNQHISPNGFCIFGHGINLLGASNLQYQDKDYDSMIWFVLNNCEEVDEYKE